MIELKINGQRLKSNNPFIVADSVNYLQIRASFTDDWEGTEKWIDFEKDGIVYQVKLDDENEVKKEKGLNLREGTYKVYVHGHVVEDGQLVERITTNQIMLEVVKTGTTDGEAFPDMSQGAGERFVEEMRQLLEKGATYADIEKAVADYLDKHPITCVLG